MRVRLNLVAAILCITMQLANTACADTLQPFQQEALDAILATADPEVRPAMQAQLEPLLAAMDAAQVKLMMAAMAQQAADSQDDTFVEEETNAVATAEDLEYNLAQYEPAIRSSWNAQKAFDEFVDAELASACGQPGTYAVFGSGWRYEVYPLQPNWPRASDSPDLDIQIIGSSYAPQDGRYRFDFSGLTLEFDRQALAESIASACSEYQRLGEAFMANAAKLRQADDLPGGFELETSVNQQASLINQKLERELQSRAPASSGALYQALLNGTKISSS